MIAIGLHRPAMRYQGVSPGVVLLLISLGLNIGWAVAVKPLNAVDEPAHLQAILQVRNQHILPEVHFRFDQDPAGIVANTPVDDAARDYAIHLGYSRPPLLLWPYEGRQPPLYYIVAGLVARIVPADPAAVLYAGRGVAALFGALAVYYCWATTRQLAPCSPRLALAVGGFVALLPQFCCDSAAASNDSTINWLSAASFYVWCRGLREPRYDPWLLRAGALFGLAILAKLSALALLPGLVFVVLFRSRQGVVGSGRGLRQWLRQIPPLGLSVAGAALAVCGWWLARNALIYGEPTGSLDLLRFSRGHFNPIDFQYFGNANLFLTWTVQNFWGTFGWTTIQLPGEYYRLSNVLGMVLIALTGIAVVGAARRMWERTIAVYTVQIGVAMAAKTCSLGFLIALCMLGGLSVLAPRRFSKRWLAVVGSTDVK